MAMAEIESFIKKGVDNLSDEEEVRLDELSDAVEAWEEVEYPMPLRPGFKDIVLHLMESQSINQSQLATELHVSASLLSGILRGQKEPNINLLKNLHSRFQIDGNILLESI